MFGVSQTLALCIGNHGIMAARLTHNGPAVEGVNVGGAVRRKESRYSSRKTVPAGKPPWRNFCKSRRKIKLSRLQDLSRAEVTDLADE